MEELPAVADGADADQSWGESGSVVSLELQAVMRSAASAQRASLGMP